MGILKTWEKYKLAPWESNAANGSASLVRSILMFPGMECLLLDVAGKPVRVVNFADGMEMIVEAAQAYMVADQSKHSDYGWRPIGYPRFCEWIIHIDKAGRPKDCGKGIGPAPEEYLSDLTRG